MSYPSDDDAPMDRFGSLCEDLHFQESWYLIALALAAEHREIHVPYLSKDTARVLRSYGFVRELKNGSGGARWLLEPQGGRLGNERYGALNSLGRYMIAVEACDSDECKQVLLQRLAEESL